MTIPTAAQAQRQAAEATKRKQRERERQRKAAEAAERKRQAKILRTEVPMRMKEVGQAIAKAIKDGNRSLNFYISSAYEGSEVKVRLERKGYKVSPVLSHSGTTNMGDSSAPCNVEFTEYWIEVSW
jgi:uncharacterized FlaG/YvyC family protein